MQYVIIKSAKADCVRSDFLTFIKMNICHEQLKIFLINCKVD